MAFAHHHACGNLMSCAFTPRAKVWHLTQTSTPSITLERTRGILCCVDPEFQVPRIATVDLSSRGHGTRSADLRTFGYHELHRSYAPQTYGLLQHSQRVCILEGDKISAKIWRGAAELYPNVACLRPLFGGNSKGEKNGFISAALSQSASPFCLPILPSVHNISARRGHRAAPGTNMEKSSPGRC